MSLDVYLDMPELVIGDAEEHIFVRENGSNVEISREEWDRRHPGIEPVTATTEMRHAYTANITHNLNRMAEEAGLYECLWRPDENGITKASQLVEPLGKGLLFLWSDRKRFEAFNPENGWGDYDGLVRFVASYLEACVAFPDADVSVWR